MLKKQVRLVLPRHIPNEQQLFHLALPQRALHTTHNQTVYYSHAGTIKNIIPTGAPEREQLEEFTFDEVLDPDCGSFFRQQMAAQRLKGLSLVIFGDNSRIKESLINSGASSNSIVKEIVSYILCHAPSVEITARMISTSGLQRSKPKKTIIENSREFSHFYSKLAESVGQIDMEAYHLELKMQYTHRGEGCTLKLVRLIDNVSEAQLHDLLTLQQTNPIAKWLGYSPAVFYWCPNPAKRCHRILKMLEELQNGNDITGFIESVSSNSKLARTDTQGSERFSKKKGNKKVDRSQLTARSKQRNVEPEDRQTKHVRKEVFRNVQNETSAKLEMRGKIMDIVMQDKNKKIQALETTLEQKNKHIEQLEIRVTKVSSEKERLVRQCEDYEQRISELLKQIVQLRLLTEQESSKALNTQHRMVKYEHEVENLHSDIKQTLEKMNGKNQKLKEENIKLRKEIADLKKAEETKAKKLEKYHSDTESSHAEQIFRLNEKHQQAIRALHEKLDKQKEEINSVLTRNHQLLGDNGRLNKDVKECYENLIQAQHKYGELCMKLRSLAHFKDSEVLTLNTILESL